MTGGRKISGPIKWAIIFVVLLYFVNIAAAYEGLEWVNGTSGTLKRNEVISFMGYSVKVVGFPAPVESDNRLGIPIEPVKPFVELNISNNGSFINTSILGEGDSFISADGEFKVDAEKLPPGLSKDWLYESYNPSVILRLSQRGKPQLAITINADDEYVSGPNTEIIAKIILKNTGTAAINNVDLDIGTELPLLRGNSKYHYETLMKGKEISETVAFSTPVISDLKKYNIFMNSSGVDIKDNSYNVTQLKTILVAPSPQQAPFLSKNTNAKAYLKDQIMVSISFKNNADHELKNVSIVDSIPEGFKLLSNITLHWIVNVGSNQEWYIRYLLKPTQANSEGVLFPSTTAEFRNNNEYYKIPSNRPTTIIYGPRIDLSKQADVSEINPGDTVAVTVIAENNGSTPTMVTITDNLPADVTLISGNTTREEYLEAGKEIRFSYTLNSNSGKPIELPPAKAEYFELGDKGTKLTTMSEGLIISIRPPPTPEPTPDPAVEIPENYSEPGNVTGNPISAINATESPEQPVIVEPEPEIYSIDSNTILNLLMGCSENNGTEPQPNMTSDVCSLSQNTLRQ